jgi:hypothetical protein
MTDDAVGPYLDASCGEERAKRADIHDVLAAVADKHMSGHGWT